MMGWKALASTGALLLCSATAGAGNLQVSGKLISMESEGPPLVVSSIAEVENLNAGLLGGLPRSAYATQKDMSDLEGLLAALDVRADEIEDSIQDLRTNHAGPFTTLAASGGKVVEHVWSGHGSCLVHWGWGGEACAPTPILRLGRTDDLATGHLPAGTVVSIGATIMMASECCTPSDQIMLNSPVLLVKYSSSHGTHPSKVRVRYRVDPADPGFIEQDWITYSGQQVGYFQLDFVVRGDSSTAGYRVVDALLTFDGGSILVIEGIQYDQGTPVFGGFFAASGSTNYHHLLAAAGRLVYP